MENDLILQAKELIEKSQRILLLSHRRPDGDTLGAACALHLALESAGKQTTLACIDEVPDRLSFIPATSKYVRDFNLADYDCVIVSDAGASHMTGFHERYPELLSGAKPMINIDHHFSNDRFGTVNIVDPAASSATVIVFRLLKAWGMPLTRDIAVALLAGIYNDTGGFMHSNTTQETFEIAAELTKAGVNVFEISSPLFKTATPPQLRLWGYILENLFLNEKKVMSSVLNESDFHRIGSHAGDTGGIIDLINTVPEASFAMLLAEDDGMVKGSLRTQREDVNVSDIAAQFGGGGHRKAAGFRVKGKLEKQVVWKIVPATISS